MYCNTHQVNQLTSLLKAHHIEHVVVCPGSRNATIVHNLHTAGSECFKLHPVTDERSAAFVALGMTLATQQAVAVCVTSGSALLGCIPAVAEAYYRHLPLLVISADRPQYIIGQLDGQTLPQMVPWFPTAPHSTLQSRITTTRCGAITERLTKHCLHCNFTKDSPYILTWRLKNRCLTSLRHNCPKNVSCNVLRQTIMQPPSPTVCCKPLRKLNSLPL